MGRRRRLALAATAALVAATGCTATEPTPTVPPPGPLVVITPAPAVLVAFECPSYDVVHSNPVGSRLPTNFQPVRALRCVLEDDAVRTQTLDTVPQALLNALALEDTARTTTSPVACLARYVVYPYVLIANGDGQAVQMWIPREQTCSDPRPDVVAVIDAQPWAG